MATEATTISTSDGETLQAELTIPDGAPRAAVVVTHPNPLMGGDMYTPVPAALFRSLDELGLAGIRFNFRGVGKSSGSHDKGQAERLDVVGAIDALTAAVPDVAILIGGWSFGADVALATDDDRIAGWFLAAAPLRVFAAADMAAASSAAPKYFAVPEVDQFSPPAVVAEQTADWAATTIDVVEGADHFFGGVMKPVVERFGRFIDLTLNAEHP